MLAQQLAITAIRARRSETLATIRRHSGPFALNAHGRLNYTCGWDEVSNMVVNLL